MAKKITKTQYKQASGTVKAYVIQEAKSAAKKGHKNVKIAAKSAAKKVGNWFSNL